MINETHFEKEFVIKYFTETLEYEKAESNTFNSELMLIPHIVKHFIYEHNKITCDKLIQQKYSGNNNLFWNELLKHLSKEIYSKFNVAIHLNPNNGIKFKFMNEEFILYSPSKYLQKNENIFTVVGQPNLIIKIGKNIKTIIPDVGIFVNGMLVSYLQLKLTSKGQTADSARGQIIGDYLSTIREVTYPQILSKGNFLSDKVKNEIVTDSLKYFHGLIHLIAMDETSSYVMRGIGKLFDISLDFVKENKANDSDLRSDFRKVFYRDSVYIKEKQKNNITKAKNFLSNTFSKQSIQNEILVYNFIQYERTTIIENGTKKIGFKNTVPTLSYPRPNQKYGVDKVINEVLIKYDNENNPNYEFEKLEQKLINQNIHPETRKNILARRKGYRNNQHIYSILLQYAAGFGKTYILCWLAIFLKELSKNNSSLFEKVLIISDRVDLRDQVDISMRNMNIDKSVFKEVTTKVQLKTALQDSLTKIVIVNIQKFPHLKEILEQSDIDAFNDKRIAFLIDEIHRSNSGIQHKEMTDMFDEITDTLCNNKRTKKNLIIGLTATPTDDNLGRFGEYQSCLEDIKWMPFDTYTMEEAIEDGFVLDPTLNKIGYLTTFRYESIVDGEKKRMPSLKEEAEDDDRIANISLHIAKTLLNVTYKKIWKSGKAMLVCYSIESAKKYYDAIYKELKLLSQLPEFSNQNIGKVYMVYTTTDQEQRTAYNICGQKSEKDVISAFRNDKNGLMIVVDKLQTGFDEPRLHTLFLDKEITGISCVQTVCRINRIMKNKYDCLVIDYSRKNNNIDNIKIAFNKYAGVVASEFNSLSVKDQLLKIFKQITETNHYIKYFNDFKNNDTPEKQMERQDSIEQDVIALSSSEESKELVVRNMNLFLEYLSKIGLVMNLINLDKKYTEKEFSLFLNEYISIVRSVLKVKNDKLEALDFWVESFGLKEEINSIIIDDLTNKKPKKSTFKIKNQSNYVSINSILDKNKEEEDKEKLIESFNVNLFKIFDKLIEVDQREGNRVTIKLLDEKNHSKDEVLDSFEKLFKKVIRRLKNDPDMEFKLFISHIEEMHSLILEDFMVFLSNKK